MSQMQKMALYKNTEKKEAYHRVGIEYRKNPFEFHPYAQLRTSDFIQGMSAIDALFNIGPEATCNMLKHE